MLLLLMAQLLHPDLSPPDFITACQRMRGQSRICYCMNIMPLTVRHASISIIVNHISPGIWRCVHTCILYTANISVRNRPPIKDDSLLCFMSSLRADFNICATTNDIRASIIQVHKHTGVFSPHAGPNHPSQPRTA